MSKTLQQKAIEASAKRSEIAGEVNTEWTPMTKHEEYDAKHLGCQSYPNCDEGVGGCLVEMGDDAEEYGHKG